MPIKKCTKNGQQGWQWGEGACFIGENAKQQAIKQALAIGKGKMPKDENDILDDDLIIEDEEKKVLGFIPPPYPSNMPQKFVTILTHTYADIRKQWVKENPNDPENKSNKQKAAKIAWNAVKEAGYVKPKDEDGILDADFEHVVVVKNIEDEIKTTLHLDVFDDTKLLLTTDVTRTQEGFLKGRAIVTNTGIFNYLVDGKIVKELRENDEVFRHESLESLKNKPLTDGHPKEMVNSENIKKYQVGFTGSDVQHNGHAISIDYTITDQEMIQKIESGQKRAFSCGYNANLDYSVADKYFFGNNPVDCRQKDIIYNHVAIVERGRAGDLAQIPIRIDSMDSFIHTQVLENSLKEDTMGNTTIKIDGVDFNVDNQVAKHIFALNTSIEKKDIELKDIRVKLTDAEAKRDAFENEVKTLKNEKEKSKLTDQEIQTKVKERIELQTIADHVKVKYDENISNKEIKLSIIKTKNDTFDATNKDDLYLDAYFDAIKGSILKDIENKPAEENKKKVFGDRVNTVPETNKSKKDMYDAYKEKMIKESQEYRGAVSVQ